MKRSDPAYDFFREDARAQGFATLADYFRHYGIVPPADYGMPAFKKKEVSGGMDINALDFIAAHGGESRSGRVIYKSWGEPGRPIIRPLRDEENDDDD